MRDSQINNYYSPGLVGTFSSLNREYMINAFRDADIRIKNYFSVANTVGLIINSMIDIFSSEIEKVEKDIEILEDFVNNYEYLAGKDDLYNSNYVEKFDNFLYDYRSDGISFDLVDRDGINFDQNGNGFVDTKSGLFKIGQNISFENILESIKSLDVKTNYEFIDHNSTYVGSIFTETLFDSWSVSIKSPAPLRNSLSEVNKYCAYDTSLINGAQACITLELDAPKLIDTIYISPNYSNGLQLLQVVVFSDEDTDLPIGIPREDRYTVAQLDQNSNLSDIIDPTSEGRPGIAVLSAPLLINNSIEVPIAKTLVKKILFIFNQSTYEKNQTTTTSSEIVARKIYDAVKHIRQERKKNTDKLQDLVYNIFLKNNSVKEFFKNQSYISNYYSYNYPCISEMPKGSLYSNQLMQDLKENGLFDKAASSIMSNVFQNFLSHVVDNSNQIFEQSTYIESNSSRGSLFNFRSPGLLPQKKTDLIGETKYQFSNPQVIGRSNTSKLVDLLSQEKIDQYEYNFSIRSIDFGLTTTPNQANKACFVSRKIPLNGHALGAKIKLIKDKANIDLTNYSLDLKDATAYELSISNVEVPDKESDWIPLLSTGQTSVSSELLFFTSTGSATTRFSFKPDSLSIYKNGIIMNPNTYKVSNKNITLLETVEAGVTYVASYDLPSTEYTQDVVDFISNGSFKETTKPAYSSSGSGELFNSTDNLNKVTLQNIPYINSAYTQTASYSPLVGTIFTGNNATYNPVKVLLADGSYAVNLTNYTKSKDYPLFSGQFSGTYFIHSGKELIFNQIVTSPFRVIYEYVPNSLRFRLILRNTNSKMNFGGSADAVIVKCKTKLYDPFYDKLTQVIYKS